MENLAKSPLSKVLGVEEDKTWSYPGCFGLYRIHSGVREYWDDNNGWLACDCEEDLIKIIAHPEAIIRTPLLTEPELAICKAHHAAYVTNGKYNKGLWVHLWNGKPREIDGDFFGDVEGETEIIAWVNKKEFPSVHPGDLIPVDPEKQ